MKYLYLLLGRLPLSLLYTLSTVAYYLVYYLLRYRRSVARDNLRHAFPDKTAAERKAIEKHFYRFLCDNLFETIGSQSMSAEELQRRVRFTNLELIQPYLDQQQSLQMLSLHQGSWEWVLQLLPVRLPMPIDAIYKPLHSQSAESFFFKLRSRFGANLISDDKAMKSLLRTRREFRAFIMIADQTPIRRDKKYWQMFLNRPAAFFLGPQKIAEITQYPLIFINIKRPRRGHYEVSFELLCEPPFERNSYQILDRYIERMEQAIRQQPETWLWSNRKWRRQPESAEEDVLSTGVRAFIKPE